MTPNKERALQALLTHKTKQAAAKAAGITSRTLTSYFRDEEFLCAYKAAAADAMQDATKKLQENLTAAIDRLGKIVSDDTEPSQNSIAAAKTILDYSLKFREFTDVLKRLEEIEGADDVL